MRIGFVCSGNICRSPMAEVICRELLGKLGVHCKISSAGTLGLEDHAAAEHAIKATFMLGIDLRDHRSQGVSDAFLSSSDALVVMAEEHVESLQDLDPACIPRVHRLWNFTAKSRRLRQIDDPVGGSLDDFINCRDILIECLENWVPEFLRDGLPPSPDSETPS